MHIEEAETSGSNDAIHPLCDSRAGAAAAAGVRLQLQLVGLASADYAIRTTDRYTPGGVEAGTETPNNAVELTQFSIGAACLKTARVVAIG